MKHECMLYKRILYSYEEKITSDSEYSKVDLQTTAMFCNGKIRKNIPVHIIKPYNAEENETDKTVK